MLLGNLFNGHYGGYGGHFMGQMYRDERAYREHYRRTGGVGGFFGSIVNSSEFDLFLTLLLFLITLNVLQKHITTAPVTSVAILLMIYLHFEKMIVGQGNTFLTTENYNRYTFHPQRIAQDSTQWYRLLTGPFLHKADRKLHLYLNMTALVVLCQLEKRSSMPVWQYTVFFLALTVTAGVCYIAVLKKYGKRGDNELATFRAIGFTGALFALKAYSNHNSTGAAPMSLPLAGDLFTYSIPVDVPGYAEHFVELFLVSVLFQGDVPFWANVGGIVAGYVFVVLETSLVAFGVSKPWISDSFAANHKGHSLLSRVGPRTQEYRSKAIGYVQENFTLLALLLVVAVYVYKSMDEREKEFQRRLAELERERENLSTTKSQERKPAQPSHQDVPNEVPLYQNHDAASAVSADQDAALSFASVEDDANFTQKFEMVGDVASSAEGESLYDDYSTSDYGLPTDFTAALKALTTITETKDQDTIAETLQTLRIIILNATTKGQQKEPEATKFRRLRLSNPRIQKCNIPGAFDLIKSIGFQVQEDFNEEKFLVYPRQSTSPDWLPAALEALQVEIDSIFQPAAVREEHDMDEVKRRMRLAALKRQAAAKKNKRKARESRFTPGMGGGDAGSYYSKIGT